MRNRRVLSQPGGVLQIHLLGQEDQKRVILLKISVTESKCCLSLTKYQNGGIVQHPGSLVFEESWYSHLCIILPIPSSPCPASLVGSEGCSLFDYGANAYTDSTLILILVWWILRNIIPRSSLDFSRFWEELNLCPSLLQGGPSLCLHELEKWEADMKAVELLATVTTWVRLLIRE